MAHTPDERSINQVRIEFLDIGRGIAVIGVIAVHVGVLFRTTSPIITLIFSCAQFGVQLFFLISAYTMCLTYEARVGKEHTPRIKFWLRRYFRLALPFWFAIMLYQIFRLTGSPDYTASSGAPIDLLLSMLLLHGFWPASFGAAVPGGGSIATEVCFYLLFPFLFSYRYSIVLLCVLIIFETVLEHFLIKPVYRALLEHFFLASATDLKLYFHYYIGAQFPIFVLGIAIFSCIKKEFLLSWLEYSMLAAALLIYFLSQTYLAVVALFFALFLILLYKYYLYCPKMLIYLLRWLGKRSYSTYLFHFAVINLFVTFCFRPSGPVSLPILLMVLLIIIFSTALVAELSRRTLENGGIAMGKYFIGKMR